MSKTKKIYNNLIMCALQIQGYDCTLDGKYIKAVNEKSNILILTKCRGWNFNGDESKPIKVCTAEDVEELENKAKSYKEDFIPAIGIGVGVGSYSNSELSVIPVSVWRERSKPGTAFSVTEREDEIALNYNLFRETAVDKKDFLLRCEINIR